MLDRLRRSKQYITLKNYFRIASEKRIDVYSAGASFYIMLSFVPYLLIFLSTIKYLPFSKNDLLAFINDIMPLDLNTVVTGIIDELYRGGIGILSVSVVAAIWASAKGVLGITKGLNEINDVKTGKNYLYMRIRSAFCTLLLMLGMILMLVISVLGDTIMNVVKKHVSVPGRIESLVDAKDIIMFIVLFVVFMFFFCVLPAKKIRIVSQIYGACGAGFLWIAFTKLFSVYLSHSNGYSMYGSFAVIMIIGVWLYTLMYIMFMGALANSLIASRKGRL